MYPANSFDKTRVEMSENSLAGRGNNSRRFPVGISSPAAAGDDNQNMRIQLAVHKYNSSPNGFISSKRRTLNSPVRHSFFKNSYKSRGYEGDSDLASKTDKKTEMQYDGVGSFPTVHLRKSAVLYRPIRKLNESKYLHPELPVNRFLNQLPELCSDLKSRTRSVLDVLQDISTKKIHSKDENDCIKCASKGLGGDLPAEEKLLTRPLFVQKPKESIVSMKDNATQTLTLQNSKVSNVMPNNSITKIDLFNPRAELRKKLAKQNNEISASLSSSISSPIALKRKLDNISAAKEDKNKSDASVVKKPKIFDNHSSSNKGNVLAVNGSKSNLKEFSSLTSKLHKLTDENATSLNKDRLTRIFLDIDNFNSKNQIFQNSDKKSSESNSYLAKDNSSIESNALINGNGNTVNNDSVESRNSFSSSKNSNLNVSKPNSFSLSGSLGKESNCGTINLVHETVSSNSVNNHSKSNEPSSSSTPPFKFDSSSKLNFISNESESKLASTNKNPLTMASSTTASTMVFQNPGTDDNVTSKNTVPEKFGVACSNENQEKNKESNNFAFGNYGNLSSNGSVFQAGGETKKTDYPASELSTAATTNSPSSGSLSFGSNGGFNPSKSSAPLQTNNNLSVQTTLSSVTNFAAKSAFTLEQTCATRQKNAVSNKPEEKTETSKNEFSFKMNSNQESAAASSASSTNFDSAQSSTTTISLGQNPPSSIFSFGQKSSGAVEASKSNEKTVVDSGANAGQQGFTPFGMPSSTAATESGNSTSVITQNSLFRLNPTGKNTDVKSSSLFSGTGAFGQKDSPVAANFSSGNVSTQSKSQNGFNFVFGQKPSDQNPSPNVVTSKENSSEQNGQVKTFTFGQSSSTQNQSNANPNTTQSTELGQNNLQSSTVSQSNQVPTLGSNQDVATMPSMNFGANTGASSNLGSFSATPIFGHNTFSAKENSFSTSLNKFGANSSKSDTKFGDSAFQTTAKFGFGSATAQSTTTFGQPQTTQTNVSFGTASGFSTTTTVMTSPKFGDSTATQPTLFGNPMSPNFAENNKPTTHEGLTNSNIFGQSNNAPSSTPAAGGFNSTITTSFNAPTGQNVFGLSTNQDSIFGKSTKIQTPAFGSNSSPAQGLATPNNFVFGSSTSNATCLTPSLPKTTASTGFTLNPTIQSSGSIPTFGSSSAPTGFTLNPSTPSSGSASTFGSSTASTGFNSASPTPFAFNSQPNNNNSFVFKPSTEGSGFINSNPSTVNFGGQMNNNNNGNNNLEAKPASGVFNFGSSQLSSGSTFNFGSTPSPSVFSFGGSGSTNSSSTFSFGTPQPGGPFGQGTPNSTMSTPGFFNIGSGSTQSRPRASSRLRRRP